MTLVEKGDAYIVEADDSFWVWDGTQWVSGGSIQGPKGDPGADGTMLVFEQLAEPASTQVGAIWIKQEPL